jgi:ribosome biogenesis GTPase A
LVELEVKKKEMNERGLYPYVFVSCTTRKGARELRDRIKMEAKRVVLPHEEMRRVQIGIIGYPNTGKSSLINFLTGGSAAKVGKEAGFTRTMQKIRLTADILILDTPGVIPEREYSTSAQELISKHAKVSARDATKVKRPDMVIQTLMREYGKIIEDYYRIKADGNGDVLIEEYGRQKNMLRRGGVVDEDRAARAILTDWQEGKILL